MIRHDLQLVQPCSRMMFWDRVPSVQDDQASIVQFHPCIRIRAYDLSEDVAAPGRTDRHEVGPTSVIPIRKARMFMEAGCHFPKVGESFAKRSCMSTQGVDGTGAHLRGRRAADHRCINFAMIPFAATGIRVPGPYTSKHPACLRKFHM